MGGIITSRFLYYKQEIALIDKLQADLNRHSSVPDVQAKVLGELYNWAFNYHIDERKIAFQLLAERDTPALLTDICRQHIDSPHVIRICMLLFLEGIKRSDKFLESCIQINAWEAIQQAWQANSTDELIRSHGRPIFAVLQGARDPVAAMDLALANSDVTLLDLVVTHNLQRREAMVCGARVLWCMSRDWQRGLLQLLEYPMLDSMLFSFLKGLRRFPDDDMLTHYCLSGLEILTESPQVSTNCGKLGYIPRLLAVARSFPHEFPLETQQSAVNILSNMSTEPDNLALMKLSRGHYIIQELASRFIVENQGKQRSWRTRYQLDAALNRKKKKHKKKKKKKKKPQQGETLTNIGTLPKPSGLRANAFGLNDKAKRAFRHAVLRIRGLRRAGSAHVAVSAAQLDADLADDFDRLGIYDDGPGSPATTRPHGQQAGAPRQSGSRALTADTAETADTAGGDVHEPGQELVRVDTEASDANSVTEQPAVDDAAAQSKKSKSGGFGFGFGRRKKRESRKTAPASAAPAVDTSEVLTTEDDPADLPPPHSSASEGSVETPQLEAERRRSSVLNPTAIEMQSDDANTVPAQASPSAPQSPHLTPPATPSEHDADDPVDRPVGRRRGDWNDGPSDSRLSQASAPSRDPDRESDDGHEAEHKARRRARFFAAVSSSSSSNSDDADEYTPVRALFVPRRLRGIDWDTISSEHVQDWEADMEARLDATLAPPKAKDGELGERARLKAGIVGGRFDPVRAAKVRRKLKAIEAEAAAGGELVKSQAETLHLASQSALPDGVTVRLDDGIEATVIDVGKQDPMAILRRLRRDARAVGTGPFAGAFGSKLNPEPTYEQRYAEAMEDAIMDGRVRQAREIAQEVRGSRVVIFANMHIVVERPITLQSDNKQPSRKSRRGRGPEPMPEITGYETIPIGTQSKPNNFNDLQTSTAVLATGERDAFATATDTVVKVINAPGETSDALKALGIHRTDDGRVVSGPRVPVTTATTPEEANKLASSGPGGQAELMLDDWSRGGVLLGKGDGVYDRAEAVHSWKGAKVRGGRRPGERAIPAQRDLERNTLDTLMGIGAGGTVAAAPGARDDTALLMTMLPESLKKGNRGAGLYSDVMRQITDARKEGIQAGTARHRVLHTNDPELGDATQAQKTNTNVNFNRYARIYGRPPADVDDFSSSEEEEQMQHNDAVNTLVALNRVELGGRGQVRNLTMDDAWKHKMAEELTEQELLELKARSVGK